MEALLNLGECSPYLEYLLVSPVPWALGANVQHVWSLVPCVLCLLQRSGSPCAPRQAGAEGEQFLAAAVSCRPKDAVCWVGCFTSTQLSLTVPCFLGL